MDLNGLSDSEVTVTQTTADSEPLAPRQTKATLILWISANHQQRRHAAKVFERDRGSPKGRVLETGCYASWIL